MRWLFLFLMTTLVQAQDLEAQFPSNHATRLTTLTQLFKKVQQSSWQWQRAGFYERDGECLRWLHDDETSTTCLTKLENKYVLTLFSHHWRDVLEFTFSEEVHFDIHDFLSFDAVKLAPKLIALVAPTLGIQFNYRPGLIHLRTARMSAYEFFITTTSWKDGLRQEMFDRCPFCSGRRYQAYLFSDGEIIYRATHLSGAINPSAWNSFMSNAYFYTLDLMAKDLDIFQID